MRLVWFRCIKLYYGFNECPSSSYLFPHSRHLLLQGRNGLGNIYVWASGDGGEDDDCNCDGYAASMWTVSINSAINDGQNAHYDESCSSTLASTFSNGAKDPNTGVVSSFSQSNKIFLIVLFMRMR